MKLDLAILEARQTKHLTQPQLAARSAIPRSHISKLENHFVVPTLQTLVRLARGLEMSPGQLLDRALDPSLDDSCVKRTVVKMRDGSRRVIPVKQRRRSVPKRDPLPSGNLVHDPFSVARRRKLGKLINPGKR